MWAHQEPGSCRLWRQRRIGRSCVSGPLEALHAQRLSTLPPPSRGGTLSVTVPALALAAHNHDAFAYAGKGPHGHRVISSGHAAPGGLQHLGKHVVCSANTQRAKGRGMRSSLPRVPYAVHRLAVVRVVAGQLTVVCTVRKATSVIPVRGSTGLPYHLSRWRMASCTAACCMSEPAELVWGGPVCRIRGEMSRRSLHGNVFACLCCGICPSDADYPPRMLSSQFLPQSEVSTGRPNQSEKSRSLLACSLS